MYEITDGTPTSLASEGKLDAVTASTTEAVDDDITATALSNMLRHSLRRHREPAFGIKLDPLVEQGKQAIPT